MQRGDFDNSLEAITTAQVSFSIRVFLSLTTIRSAEPRSVRVRRCRTCARTDESTLRTTVRPSQAQPPRVYQHFDTGVTVVARSSAMISARIPSIRSRLRSFEGFQLSAAWISLAPMRATNSR